MNDRGRLWESFYTQGRVAECPVIDMHGHMGPFYGSHLPWNSTDKMIAEMDRANVRMLVFCYHAALLSPDIRNSTNIEAARRYPSRLRAYCGINPNYPDLAASDIAAFEEAADVYVGFKFLSDYHRRPLSDDAYTSAWELANDRGLIVLLHTGGGSEFTSVEEIRKAATRYPNARIIMGHSLHGDWDNAASLVREFPNVYMDTCAVVDERTVLERLVERGGSDKIVFGTDFPWFDFFYYIGAILGAGIGDEHASNILFRNAKKLLENVGVDTDCM